MTYATEEMTITTWGKRDGRQQWRVRHNNGAVAEFPADRLVPVLELFQLARVALGMGDG